MILARRSGEEVRAAINAEKEIKKVNVRLPMFTGKKVNIYFRQYRTFAELKQMNIKKEVKSPCRFKPEGGVITNCRIVGIE